MSRILGFMLTTPQDSTLEIGSKVLWLHNPLNVACVSHVVEIPSVDGHGANEFHLVPEIVRGCKCSTYFDEQKPGYIEVAQMVHCLKKDSKCQPVEALDIVGGPVSPEALGTGLGVQWYGEILKNKAA